MWSRMLEDNCYDPTKTRVIPDQMPLKHSQDLLAQHHLKQRTEKQNRNEHWQESYKHGSGSGWDMSAACPPTPSPEQP